MSDRWLGIFGLVAPCVGLSLVLFATTQASWFSWQANALSDLGVGETAIVFNTGLILAGLLALPLSSALWGGPFHDLVGRVGATVLALACLSLVMIGVFSEEAGRIHYWVSVAFFTFLPLAMFILSASMALRRRSEDAVYLVLTLVLALIAGLAWAMPHDGVAIPEIISSTAGSAWFVVFGLRLWADRTKQGSPRAGL